MTRKGGERERGYFNTWSPLFVEYPYSEKPICPKAEISSASDTQNILHCGTSDCRLFELGTLNQDNLFKNTPNSVKLQTHELLVTRISSKCTKHIYEILGKFFPLSPVQLSVITSFYLIVYFIKLPSFLFVHSWPPKWAKRERQILLDLSYFSRYTTFLLGGHNKHSCQWGTDNNHPSLSWWTSSSLALLIAALVTLEQLFVPSKASSSMTQESCITEWLHWEITASV